MNGARRSRYGFLFFAALLAGVPAAWAGDSRWYLEGQVGQTHLERTFGSRYQQRFDSDDRSLGVEVGYTVSRFLAIQGGVHDLGEFGGLGSPCPQSFEGCITGDVIQIDPPVCIEGPSCFFPAAIVGLRAEVTGLTLALVPRWPVTDSFSVYAKAGVLDWESDLRIAEPGTFGEGRLDKFSDRDRLLGLGAQYLLPRGLGLKLEVLDTGLDLASASLGASWRF